MLFSEKGQFRNAKKFKISQNNLQFYFYIMVLQIWYLQIIVSISITIKYFYMIRRTFESSLHGLFNVHRIVSKCWKVMYLQTFEIYKFIFKPWEKVIQEWNFRLFWEISKILAFLNCPFFENNTFFRCLQIHEFSIFWYD